MGQLTINAQKLAQLKSFAQRGSIESGIVSELLDGVKVLELTNDSEGDEAANTIRVSGQIRDMDGSAISGVQDIHLRARNATEGSTGDVSVVTGTAVVGDASHELWFQTDANGAFAVDVLNTATEDELLVFMLDDGVTETLKLTFA